MKISVDNNQQLPDQQQRVRALDPASSFIVQAPAGSGKTELLTQRYLALLAHVRSAPEEIVAITFTRKAAAEMRARIVQALTAANNNVKAVSQHEQTTRQLATNVLARNHQLKWDLLENPNRLRILTIDALCARITTRMPVLTHFGVQPKISENINDLYRQATREILATLEHEQFWSEPLATILLHLDNDHSKAERLLIDMLSRRDQWLMQIMNHNPREVLERSLANVIIEQLNKLHVIITQSNTTELLTLLQFAVNTCKQEKIASPLLAFDDVVTLPTVTVANLNKWQAIAHFLLTKDNNWRKKITINEGFPPVSSGLDNSAKSLYQEMKQRMSSLLEELSENKQLRYELKNTLELPPAKYNDEQWEIISALVMLLPILVAQLAVLFKEYGLVDHTEITLKAISALGTAETPTDLALSLDYQIQHLLVDEFQDTSITQFRLLEQLTAGWEPNDGRTIFLVGDPMQSIYRFRKAEVSLFLQAQQCGIGNVKLQSLQLTANFRARAEIIAWINAAFEKIFPHDDDITTGAIRFCHSHAVINSIDARIPISVHPLINATKELEAQTIVDIIRATKISNPNASIAILVQARSHLTTIIPALKAAQINYRAIEIEALALRAVIQDLLALTKALVFHADRVAWLSLLRAPCCGLSLTDLHVIASAAKHTTIWDQLLQYPNLPLSDDAKSRLERIIPILLFSHKNRQRKDFTTWIENTWLRLGGPASLTTTTELDNAKAYFKLLAKQTPAGDLQDFIVFEELLANLTATTTTPDETAVEIMTIHKAKGLEFDSVILPCLEKQTRSDSHQLLLWQERPSPEGSSDLILAPIKKAASDPIYDYLRRQENNKASHELKRLLYVAITRAKNCLHLLGHVTLENGDIKAVPTNSFLEQLWVMIGTEFKTSNNAKNPLNETDIVCHQPQNLRRLTANWQHPLVTTIIEEPKAFNNTFLQTRYQWQPDPLKQIGTAIHKMIYQVTVTGSSNWQAEKINNYQQQFKQLLIRLNVVESALNNAIEAIKTALLNIITDPRGKWIINADHENAAAEYPLTAVIDGEVKSYIIDRTFIEKGVRWIIDYKTTDSFSGDPTTFLQQEKNRHRQQLEEYAYAFRLQESYPIRLGVYYPLLKLWLEWEFLRDL